MISQQADAATSQDPTTQDTTPRYSSLAELRLEHSVLLKARRDSGETPVLMAAGVPGSEQWDFRDPFVPGSTPLTPLAHVMSTTEDAFRQQPDHLRQLAESATQPLVLVVDQFEELFTVCTSESDRAAFVDN